ncbi:hypothetical protein B0T19DRAFT_9499 [Cercophora scortea]|uniref:Uncharacterized protein n=1 Tax=Cercophora scortea TaxID=314031 RepID=A0AAE0J2S3_9PEZI|nr:hypothetical protein B0T19DRAFT_9499 [Cercophora scortea]
MLRHPSKPSIAFCSNCFSFSFFPLAMIISDSVRSCFWSSLDVRVVLFSSSKSFSRTTTRAFGSRKRKGATIAMSMSRGAPPVIGSVDCILCCLALPGARLCTVHHRWMGCGLTICAQRKRRAPAFTTPSNLLAAWWLAQRSRLSATQPTRAIPSHTRRVETR